MHPRNLHKDGYNFKVLIKAHPQLAGFVRSNPLGRQTIDFSNPNAVKALNTALLKHHYKIEMWDIPDGYLCPPIPGRADYIHGIADLIYGHNTNDVKCVKNNKVRGLDIGTGANLIYPIIGKQVYDWQFVATDIDEHSLASASTIQNANKSLLNSVALRHQQNAKAIFAGIIDSQEQFTFSMCNPPFHASEKEAKAGSTRKRENLHKNRVKRGPTGNINNKRYPLSDASLNFSGQHNELWCAGGEVGFILRMIGESEKYKHQVKWFTSLVSKKESLIPIKKYLNDMKTLEVKVVEMGQGSKISRFIAWCF